MTSTIVIDDTGSITVNKQSNTIEVVARNEIVVNQSAAIIIDESNYTIDVATGATGQGVPPGGTAGQALTKIDGSDYNTHWSTISGGTGNNGPDTFSYSYFGGF